MPEFSRFDRRHYPILPVRDGYAAWQPTYEDAVDDRMDLALLERVETVGWESVADAVDLGCGTGRTARWLRSKGVGAVDGVDMTPEMLAAAAAAGVHRRLVEADVRETGLPAASCDLAVCSLVNEHLPDLRPLYAEARRLLRAAGTFVLVGYHPFFMMMGGVPTHFDGPDGEPVAIETHLHLLADHVVAARAAGLAPMELHEAVIDEGWLESKPQWERYLDWPVSFCWVFA